MSNNFFKIGFNDVREKIGGACNHIEEKDLVTAGDKEEALKKLHEASTLLAQFEGAERSMRGPEVNAFKQLIHNSRVYSDKLHVARVELNRMIGMIQEGIVNDHFSTHASAAVHSLDEAVELGNEVSKSVINVEKLMKRQELGLHEINLD